MNYIISEYRPWEIKNISHTRAGQGYLRYNKTFIGDCYFMFYKGCLYRALPLSKAKCNRAEIRRAEKYIKLMLRPEFAFR